MTTTPNKTKSCPHCSGEIFAAATKCKHCKEYIEVADKGNSAAGPPPTPTIPAVASQPSGSRAHKRRTGLIVGGAAFGIVVIAGIAAAVMFSGDESSTKGEKPKSSPRQQTAPSRPKESKLAYLHRLVDTDPFTSDDCATLSDKASVPSDLCNALAGAIRNGRTTPKSRRDLRNHLKAGGYFRLRGYIVANHGEGMYEIYRYGRRLHAVLKTNLTSYTTRGRFALWAKKVGRREIKTKNGFTQTWDVFQEDPFGSVVQRVFNARAGARTSAAAKTALKALVTLSRGGRR